MSILKNDFALKKEPPLPSGWEAYPSKSHPDKVYYYNVFTGRSSWERPTLKHCYGSNGVQYSGKSPGFIAESRSSNLEKSSHKPWNSKLTSATNKRLDSGINNSGILPHKSHVLQVTMPKQYESRMKKHDGTVKRKISANDKICVVNEASVENEYQRCRATSKEVILRKRKGKERPSGSVEVDNDSDKEKPPSGKIKLSNSVICQSSSGSTVEMLHSDKKNSQSVLPSATRGRHSSGSSASESRLRKDDVQHKLKVKTLNKISPDHTVVKAGLHNIGRRKDVRGLAAKRLRSLQTKLAEGRVRKEKSEAEKNREPPQRRKKVEDLSSNSSGFVKLKAAKYSETVQKKLIPDRDLGHKHVRRQQEDSLPLKHRNVPETTGRGFGECKAAKRLEVLQRKLISEQNLGRKQMNIQQDSFPLKNENVTEACSGGLHSKERSLLHYVGAYGSLIGDNERFSGKTMEQNLSEQHLYVTDEGMNQEDELMEWEPVEDEKILSHIQEVRSQIQRDGSINPGCGGIQTVDCSINSIFCADGKPEWFIVIDTNILISSLHYIEELRDTNFKGFGCPVLVIPWQVLQELDIMKDKRGNVKNSSLATRASRAVSFLHSNFASKHPRLRGQTPLDAVPKDFKMEVPDDAILHCCFQIAQRTDRVILLSNDRNLCNKALVSGIKAYQKTELQQTLEELGSETVDQIQIQSSSGNELSVTNMGIPAAADMVSSAEVASIVDSVLCKLKSLLKELLGRVLENEMYKAYDNLWKTIVLVKPPWTLSDIIICLLKHWIAVFSIVLPAEVKVVLESLKRFFDSARQNKGYGHSLLEVKTMLQASLHLCMAIQSDEYRDLVTTCVSNIERLNKRCEETLAGLTKEDEKEKFKFGENKSQNENVNIVMDILKKCLELVQSFCALMCDVLGWEHHVLYNRPEPLPTVDIIQARVQYIYPRVDTLIKNITSILDHPVSALTVDHEAVKNLYITLANFLESQEVEEKITPKLILNFCTTESTRCMLEITKSMFEEAVVVLNRGIHYFLQCGIV